MDNPQLAILIVVFFGPAVILLGFFIRHGIPVVRGIKRGWTSTLMGPLVLFSDNQLTDEAKRHRTKCLAYGASFMAWCFLVVWGGDWLLK